MNDVVIDVKQISKKFKLSKKQQKALDIKDKYKIAVKELSFQVYKGEIYGLLGPNGAGKTTTMRMLATLYKPTSGTAIIAGYDVIEEEEMIRKNIGFLTGDLQLEPNFTPNYLFDFFSKLYDVDYATKEARKEELFTRFGINEYGETKIQELSTGMKQKVSLAISMVHNPDIIIFDEPTNGLDILAAKTVTDYLLQLKKENKTVIISTHIFSLIEKLCDRVGIIFQGTMICSDDLHTICDGLSLEDRFFQLYEKYERED